MDDVTEEEFVCVHTWDATDQLRYRITWPAAVKFSFMMVSCCDLSNCFLVSSCIFAILLLVNEVL